MIATVQSSDAIKQKYNQFYRVYMNKYSLCLHLWRTGQHSILSDDAARGCSCTRFILSDTTTALVCQNYLTTFVLMQWLHLHECGIFFGEHNIRLIWSFSTFLKVQQNHMWTENKWHMWLKKDIFVSLHSPFCKSCFLVLRPAVFLPLSLSPDVLILQLL